MIENLKHIAVIGGQVEEALHAGDTAAFGELLHEHWVYKRERSSGMTNTKIDEWYGIARDAGAIGGKLVGAGGGGFLMFYVRDRERVRKAMHRVGLREVRFAFDHDGSHVLVRA